MPRPCNDSIHVMAR